MEMILENKVIEELHPILNKKENEIISLTKIFEYKFFDAFLNEDHLVCLQLDHYD